MLLRDGHPLCIELPQTIDLEIVDTAPAIKGATATNRNKPATLANGVSVLRVTPDVLATPCREKYLITPADIFRSTGVYTVRVILVNPADTPET